MIKVILVSACAAILVGCGTPQIKIVTVDKPIPVIPSPPKVPECTYLVDALTPETATPGDVGEAYKHDMTCLRATNSMFRQIVNAYKEAADSTAPIVEEITKAFKKMQADIDAANKPSTDK